jgi:hypothetical protein
MTHTFLKSSISARLNVSVENTKVYTHLSISYDSELQLQQIKVQSSKQCVNHAHYLGHPEMTKLVIQGL